MATEVSGLISIAKRLLNFDHLELILNIDGNVNSNRIRQQISQWTEQNFRLTKLQTPILDLNSIPQITPGDLSISHCPQSSGFCVSVDANVKIGFDIEVIERVTKQTAQRVSRATELSSAPGAAHLWSAKEASFKRFAKASEIKLISEVQVSKWKAHGTGVWSFQGSWSSASNMSGAGVSFELSTCIYTIFK